MARARPVSAEDRLIARYFRPLASHPGALGLIDDCALLTPPPGSDLVLKTDAVIGGMHFFNDDPAEAVAKKALRVNLSDLAAKGAAPAGFLMALALPRKINAAWLNSFARGLGTDARTYRCPLLGGDTDRTPGPVTVAITVFGLLPRGSMRRRDGARAGDRVFVTGTIGDAALGLLLRRDPGAGERWSLTRRERDHLARRYLLPQPRTALAPALRNYAHAGMDVSDGLVGDFDKLCAASGLAGAIEAARVPLSSAARKAIAAEPALLSTVLTGGDDYEVIGTAGPRQLARLKTAGESAGVAVTEIGEMRRGPARAQFFGANGRSMLFKHTSFSHF